MATSSSMVSDQTSAKRLAEDIQRSVGGPVQPYSDGSFNVRCPSHDDSNPSLSVSYVDGKPLVHCHAGCSQSSVISALKSRNLWPKPENQRQTRLPSPASPVSSAHVFSDPGHRPQWILPSVSITAGHPPFYFTAYWLYRAPDGSLIGAVARYDRTINGKLEKSFRPYFRPHPTKSFTQGHVLGQPHPLYQLDKLYEDTNSPVWITEGEQAASALGMVGALSTTSPNGSKSAQKSDWSMLSGRDLIVWPDADKAGDTYAQQVFAICKAMGAASIRFVDISALSQHFQINDGWDAADWVREQGCDLSLVPLTANYKPYAGSTSTAATSSLPKPAAVLPPSATVPGASKPAPAPNASGKPANKSRNTFRRSPIYTPIIEPDFHPKTGDPLPTFATALYEIQRLYPNISMNDFTNKIFIDDYEFQEFDTDEIAFAIHASSHVNINPQIVYRAINLHANRNSFHPVRDYLLSLTWDGIPRIDHWLPDIFGCDCTDYTMQAGKNFLIGAAARILSPGIKMDYMLVLFGHQGKGKSTACQVLVGDPAWFTSTKADPSSKDFYQILSGHWIVELDELDAFRNGRDSTIKSAISTSTDTYRPPYARTTAAFPRQNVFIGTTDKREFLKDTAGNRRYWPVTVTDVRIDLLEQNRDQYWAEAVHRFSNGESFHEMPEEAFTEQEKFRRIDPWETIIEQYLRGLLPREQYPDDAPFPPESVSTLELLKYAIMLPVERMDKRAEMRVGNSLAALQWDPVQVRVMGTNIRGKTVTRERRYFPPEGWDDVSI